MRALFSISLLIAAPGCGKLFDRDSGPSDTSTGPFGVSYHSSVPEDQRTLIDDDLSALASMQISSQYTADDKKLVGIEDFSATSMSNWLRERIKIITGESFSYGTQTVEVALNSNQKPILYASTSSADTIVTAATTIMFNLGAKLYLEGLNASTLKYLYLSESPTAIKTPRTGIVQIGAGLFTVNRLNSVSDLKALPNRLVRLATLFHEARHSDGNGDHVAFPHAKCSASDNRFANEYACEQFWNGPYQTEAVVLTRFYYSCSSCSNTELSGINKFITDSYSRLQSNSPYKDPKPESL